MTGVCKIVNKPIKITKKN